MSDFLPEFLLNLELCFMEMLSKKKVIGHRLSYLVITIRYEAERSRFVFKENMEAYDMPINLVVFEISCIVSYPYLLVYSLISSVIGNSVLQHPFSSLSASVEHAIHFF